MVVLGIVILIFLVIYFLALYSDPDISKKPNIKIQKLWIYICAILLGIMCICFYPAGGEFTNIIDAFECRLAR